ncbi:hypothetical protein N9D91_03310 [Planktomarina temperata]|nr:hypothetical protein [Planktomarina temperata]
MMGYMRNACTYAQIALGGEPGMALFIALKSKGMWQRNYYRKRFEIQ